MAQAAPYAFSTWEYVLSIVDKEVRGVGEGAAISCLLVRRQPVPTCIRVARGMGVTRAQSRSATKRSMFSTHKQGCEVVPTGEQGQALGAGAAGSQQWVHVRFFRPT